MKTIWILSLLAFVSLAQTSSACDRHESQFKGFATVSHYPSEAPKTEIIAVILPATGGENFLDRQLAKNLCERGISSVIFNYRQDSVDVLDVQGHDRVSAEFITFFQQFLENESKPSVVIGASLGGLYASMSLGMHLSGIEGAVLTVAGGSLADILGTSTLESVTKQRLARQEDFHIDSISDYVDFMKKHINYDPLKMSDPSMSQRVLMLSSSRDTAVPTKTQEQLWLSWGRPKRITKPLNHALSVAYYYSFYIDQIAEFILTLPSSQKIP